jgi:hypothetical protein
MLWLLDLLKGLFIGTLYLQITGADETTLENIARFAFFFIVMVNGARFIGIDQTVVANAFISKTIFTLVEDRIKKKDVDNDIKKIKTSLLGSS